MTTNGRRPAISFKVWKIGAESQQRLLTSMQYNEPMRFRKKKRLTEMVDCAG